MVHQLGTCISSGWKLNQNSPFEQVSKVVTLSVKSDTPLIFAIHGRIRISFDVLNEHSLGIDFLKKKFQNFFQKFFFRVWQPCSLAQKVNFDLIFSHYLCRCQVDEPLSFIHQKNSNPLVMTWFEGFRDLFKYKKVKGGKSINTNFWTPCRYPVWYHMVIFEILFSLYIAFILQKLHIMTQ